MVGRLRVRHGVGVYIVGVRHGVGEYIVGVRDGVGVKLMIIITITISYLIILPLQNQPLQLTNILLRCLQLTLQHLLLVHQHTTRLLVLPDHIASPSEDV